MAEIELSVIILSFNTQKFIKDCLLSVAKAAKNVTGTVEVIFVDNASTDESIAVIESEKKAVEDEKLAIKVLTSSTNTGFAGGCNLGIKEARGQYLLFLNMDTMVFPEAFKKAIDFMESDSRYGAMTPYTRLVSGGMDPDCHRGFPTPWASITYFLGLEKLFPQSRFFGQYHRFYLDLSKPHEIDAGFGTFLMVRKEVVDKIGPWDEQYFFYGEDLDYFYRIKKAGLKVMFYPEPLLWHYKGGSSGLRKESRKISPASRETRMQVAKSSVKAMEIFYKKFYRNQYPSFVTFLVLLAIKIKGSFRIIKYYFS